MKEYKIEEGKETNLDILKTELMPLEDYKKAHKNLIIVCHDVFIEYNKGILLVTRNNFPAKGILWPIGGRVLRGLDIKNSLIKKVKEECSLELEEIIELGYARTLFWTDPFNHGKGTDTINFVYFSKSKGKLKLDNLHEKPKIILPKDYTKEFRKEIHPYVKEFMDKAIKLI